MQPNRIPHQFNRLGKEPLEWWNFTSILSLGPLRRIHFHYAKYSSLLIQCSPIDCSKIPTQSVVYFFFKHTSVHCTIYCTVCGAVRLSGAPVIQYLDTLYVCLWIPRVDAQIFFLSPQSANPQIPGLYPLCSKSVHFLGVLVRANPQWYIRHVVQCTY